MELPFRNTRDIFLNYVRRILIRSTKRSFTKAAGNGVIVVGMRVPNLRLMITDQSLRSARMKTNERKKTNEFLREIALAPCRPPTTRSR